VETENKATKLKNTTNLEPCLTTAKRWPSTGHATYAKVIITASNAQIIVQTRTADSLTSIFNKGTRRHIYPLLTLHGTILLKRPDHRAISRISTRSILLGTILHLSRVFKLHTTLNSSKTTTAPTNSKTKTSSSHNKSGEPIQTHTMLPNALQSTDKAHKVAEEG
jgi:hypothetical protein